MGQCSNPCSEKGDAVVTAARGSSAEFMGLSGGDRAILYLCAVSTAFRPVELSRLAPADFLLDGVGPLVRLDGTRTKNGKTAEQPVSSAVAAELREYVSCRPTGEPVWPGEWFTRGADMIRVDIAAAGIPPNKSAVGGGELVVSLYTLRHSVPVLLEAAGATLREVMTFMRHSDPKLTLKTYGRLGKTELAAVAGMMPALLPAASSLTSPQTSPRMDCERGFVRTVGESGGRQGSAGETTGSLELKERW
jgi:integrase/recombinase XerC